MGPVHGAAWAPAPASVAPLRRAGFLVTAAATCLLAGCGNGASTAAPDGSPERPQPGEHPAPASVVEAHGAGAAAAAPSKPRSPGKAPGAAPEARTAPAQEAAPVGEDERTTPSVPRRSDPCRLLRHARAERIVGARLRAPVLAPQGPTCIYRAVRGARFITLTVQESTLAAMSSGVRERRAVTVGGRRALCLGRDTATLLVRLSQRRTLAVGAPCAVARRLAVHVVDRLDRAD
jgi:hypothetical protein